MLILLLLLVVAGSLLLVPMLMGIEVESRYDEFLGRFEQAGVVIVDHEFQRGWFGSSSRTLLELPGAARESDNRTAAEKPGLGLHSDIYHGPFSGRHGFQLAEIDSELESAVHGMDEPAVMHTIIRFDGTGESLLTLSEMSLVGRTERVSTEIGGLSATITFDRDFSEGSVSFDIPVISLRAVSGNRLEFYGSNATSGYQLDPGGLGLDGGTVEVKRINLIRIGQDGAAVLEDPSLGLSITGEGEHIDIALEYAHQSLVFDDSTYGPARLRLELDNLSRKALFGIGQGFGELLARRQVDNRRENLMLAGQLLTSSIELLKYGPAVALEELHFEMPDGVIEAKVSLQVDGDFFPGAMHSSDMLDALTADGSFAMPEQTFLNLIEKSTRQEIRQQFEERRSGGEEVVLPDEVTLRALSMAGARARLDHLLQQQLLVRNGKSVTTSIKLNNGQIFANGIQVGPDSIPPEQEE